MLKIFEKYVLKEILKNFLLLTLTVFPIIFLGNALAMKNLTAMKFFLTCIYVYEKIYLIILFIAIFITIQKILYKDTRLALVSAGFKKQNFVKIIFLLYFFILFFQIVIVERVNDSLFVKYSSNIWLIQKQEKGKVIIIPRLKYNTIVDIFVLDNEHIQKKRGIVNENTLTIFIKDDNELIAFLPNNLYFNWSHERLLSIADLKEYIQYLQDRNLKYNSKLIILYTKYIKFISYLIFLFLAFMISFKKSILQIISTIIVYIWLDQVLSFLVFEYSLIFIFLNLIFWIIFNIILTYESIFI